MQARKRRVREAFPFMIIQTFPNADELSRHAASLIERLISQKPHAVLGLATGSTPEGAYSILADQIRKGRLNWKSVTTFNLDEYMGLPPDHPQSYWTFMWEKLFRQIGHPSKSDFIKHVNAPRGKIFIPDGIADSIEGHCRWYEDQIRRRGGIDLQILGIGRDGHIAFNEPGSPHDSRTRRVALLPETIEDNARFFKSRDDVPREAVTMGIGTILEARQILLLATGKKKAEPVRRALEEPPSLDISASALQNHPHVVVLLDQEAASALTNK